MQHPVTYHFNPSSISWFIYKIYIQLCLHFLSLWWHVMVCSSLVADETTSLPFFCSTLPFRWPFYSHPTLQPVSRKDEVTKLDPHPMTLRSPTSADVQDTQAGDPYSCARFKIISNNPLVPVTNPCKRLKPKPGYEHQLEVITVCYLLQTFIAYLRPLISPLSKAVAVAALQMQMFSTAITATAHVILAVSVILELIGILLAICFSQLYHADSDVHHSQPNSTPVRFALCAPTLLISTGIVGLGAALVVETLQRSLSAAVTMSSLLAFGIIICLLAWLRRSNKAAVGKDDCWCIDVLTRNLLCFWFRSVPGTYAVSWGRVILYICLIWLTRRFPTKLLVNNKASIQCHDQL